MENVIQFDFTQLSNSTQVVKNIANFYLSKSGMTHKKLQKIVYYAVAWNYTINKSFFSNTQIDFEAWVHGPVNRELYSEYREYGYNEIEQVELDSRVEFSHEEVRVLEMVWEVYGDKTGNLLETLTHQEDPWINQRVGLGETESSNRKILFKDIKEFYSRYLSEEN